MNMGSDAAQVVLDAIKSRRSIRKFQEMQVNNADLQAVLEAGTYAPTARNTQSPIIVAVQNADLRARLSALNAKVWGTDKDPYYGAPTFVLVYGPDPATYKNTIQDASLVLGNMMLAAHAVGLGSCWINREIEMSATAEGKALQRELGVPDDYIGVGALSLGYPAMPNPDPRPRKEDYYRIVK